MAAKYTAEQIQQALQAGLITQEDAQYLMESLEPGTDWGGMAGGTLGALGGAALGGAAGAKIGSKIAGHGMPGMPAATLASGLAGGVAGGMGGEAAGEAMLPPEPGLGAGPMGGEQNKMIQMLMDPRTPPEVKKQIMAALQQMQEGGQEQPGQEGNFPWGQALGAGLGAAGLGAAGYKLGPKMAEMAGLARGPSNDMFSGLAMSGAGAGAGGLAGGIAGDAMMPPSPYEDPYGGM